MLMLHSGYYLKFISISVYMSQFIVHQENVLRKHNNVTI